MSFILLNRKLFHHDIWNSEPFTKGQAWVDLLFMAAHERKVISIRGNEVVYNRGQVVASERYFSERWRWSRGKVRRYFGELKLRQMVVQQKTRLCTLTTVVNYNEYQFNSTTDRTTERPQKDLNKEREERNRERDNRKRFVPPTVEECILYFTEKGSTNQQGESFFHHYESVGWKVGKNKMQKWRSAASGWISREKNKNAPDRGKRKSAAERYLEEYGSGSSS